MRSTIAKRIRRLAYGTGHHLGPVLYYRDTKGTVSADNARRLYQRLKHMHRAGTLFSQQ